MAADLEVVTVKLGAYQIQEKTNRGVAMQEKTMGTRGNTQNSCKGV